MGKNVKGKIYPKLVLPEMGKGFEKVAENRPPY